MITDTNISKKKKFVADGIFYAELNEFLKRELASDGYSGVEVRTNPKQTRVIINATKPSDVAGPQGRRIRELTAVIQKRFNFSNEVFLFINKVPNHALSAIAQAESVKQKLLEGVAVRRAAHGVIRFVMKQRAKGCEVVVSGKLRAQRAKAMKFRDGYMIKTGYPTTQYVDTAIRHVKMKQGVLGVKVSIMLPHDPEGKNGPSVPQPDFITVNDPKEDELLAKAAQV
eukprot:gb/GECH01011223.1/.p1 GENE.gb/GECH01011223.1/~~gb/GECH01011223.1/.p1  ORF type:complete len:227 (+),score=35.54 gb/GECH01011223.1/:1-681(+)